MIGVSIKQWTCSFQASHIRLYLLILLTRRFAFQLKIKKDADTSSVMNFCYQPRFFYFLWLRRSPYGQRHSLADDL